MDLTAKYARDARRVIADTDDADYTNPDLPHRTAVRLIVRVVEMLRTMTAHAERLQESVDRLTVEAEALRRDNSDLHIELATRDDAVATA